MARSADFDVVGGLADRENHAGLVAGLVLDGFRNAVLVVRRAEQRQGDTSIRG